ncbi:uncharacterized protein B0P05DRAFT_479671 [Gilbertella persicaria]|uniref:uncharacterized protein n=1 Tax=Gilbertella persicaria TaxID=101096 RepID=UPI00221F20CF|nr:uncharacterized protein B0P05DRAFT_479671 [Gilbertella persicaria]KAI8053652.1 hypothetical protein B0P05DRAFT_479671 [Gilbertella persicaria]
MCNTWEDVIWVYLNARIEALMDKNESVNLVLSEEIVNSALSKDHIMERDDPRVLFHHIQMSLLSKNPQDIVKKIYHAYHHKQIKSHHPSLYISENLEIRTQLLRFISTFVLYGHEYLGWKETMYSAAFLLDYAKLNTEPTTLRPVVIATYASKQSPQYQIQMYSHFLQGFDGDDQECAILLQLGKEFDLDMHDILQYTHTHLFKKAIEQVMNPQKEKIDFKIQGEITESDTMFFRSVQWLTLDQSMCIEAFEAANLTIRYFLGVCKIYLAQHVFDLFSDTLIERMSVASQNKMRALKILTEFNSHKKLVSLFTDFELWKQLLQCEPQDNGSVDDLLEINKWRDQVEASKYRKSYIAYILE